jgi:hypothetical protein
MWHELVGTWAYAASTGNDTLTIPGGGQVVQIIAHSTSGGTLTIFGGSTITIIGNAAPTIFRFNHTLVQSGNEATIVGSTKIVASSGIDSLFVEYIKAGNT